MNILIGTFRYLSLTGTETFTYTLLKSLSSQKGVKVFFYSPFIGGQILKQSKKLNVFLSNDLNDFQNEKIDLIHAQQNLTSILLRYRYPDIPMIYFKHGLIDFLDQVPEFISFNYYGGTSLEIYKHLNSLNISKNKLFYFPNSIDTDRFSPQKQLPLWPKNLLVLSNYLNKKGKKIIKKVARDMNLKVAFLGRSKQKFAVEKEINKADIVMSLGRGIIEAMSCKKAVLIFSYDSKLYTCGDGILDKKNADILAKSNFSGRAKKIPFTEENLKKELKKYDPKMDDFNRQYVLDHFDIAKNLNILTNIYTKAKEEKAGKYDKKQVDFMANSIQKVLDYENLNLSYKDPKKLLLKRFKDQLIKR